jgi:hypothetical protein
MAKEATSGRSHEEIQGHVRNLPKGTGRTIGGHRVDRTQKDRYRVGLKTDKGRDTRLYDSPEHAARALHEGKHHEAGGAAQQAGGARNAAADKAVREMAGKSTGRYVVKLTGEPNADKTHYGVWDKEASGWLRRDITHTEARERAIQANRMPATRKPSAPQGDERPYAQTPDDKLQEMVARGGNTAAAHELAGRIQAREKARMEAENKASGRGGVTRNTAAGVGVGRPDLAGGATPPKGGAHKQPTSETYRRDIVGRQNLDEAARAKWLGRTVEITHGIDAGKSGKVIKADKYGITVDTGDGKRSTPGVNQFREAPTASVNIDKKISAVESSFREEGISYTPQDLVATRLDSVLADLKAGDTRITIKVPSGSEVTIPRDVAIELANRARKNQQSYLRGRY